MLVLAEHLADALDVLLGGAAGIDVAVGLGPHVGERLVAFELGEPAVPRHGHPIWHDGTAVGTVTSGMRSPTLGTFIGLGYVTSGVSAPTTPIAVEIRGRHVPGRIVNRPFYRRVRQEQAR